MKAVLLLVMTLAIVGQGKSFIKRKAPMKIVNGVDVAPGEIPFQVSIHVNYGKHFCGGSILNTKYVLTAAHCIYAHLPSDIYIVAGTVDLDDPVVKKEVEKIIYHEKYDRLHSRVNDIGLVRIQGEFETSSTLNFVKLPEPNVQVAVGSIAIVSGWGRLQTTGPSPKILQKATIQIADQEFCRKVYNESRYIHDSQICAYDPNEGKGSCLGDSGGPLTVNGVLIGIDSWARECALTTHPSVFTRVSEYLDWITYNTN